MSGAAVDDARLAPAIEAVLLVVDEPVAVSDLARALDRDDAEVEQSLVDLAHAYDDEARGFQLRRAGAGWRLYTRQEYAEVVERFVLDDRQSRLSRAALETLAVVAYRQPVSRSAVAAIRGVNVDSVMRTLENRGLVADSGAEATSGAVLYATTDHFLERIGLTDLAELPDLAPFLPPDDEATDLLTGPGARPE